MRIHLPFPRHNKTAYVMLDTGSCQACEACVEHCPNGVMGMISFGNHRHAHVDNAKSCTGCLSCVAACSHGAIRLLQQSEVA